MIWLLRKQILCFLVSVQQIKCSIPFYLGAVWTLETVHQSDPHAAARTVRPGQTPRICILWRWIWACKLLISVDYLENLFFLNCIWKQWPKSWNVFAVLCSQGGWWWLWCLLHYCWWKPHQLPHLQQILELRNCKFNSSSNKCVFMRLFKLFFFSFIPGLHSFRWQHKAGHAGHSWSFPARQQSQVICFHHWCSGSLF